MKREKAIELAKLAKLAAYEDEIIEFARLVELETLERAARVCDHCANASGAALASAKEYRDEDAEIEISCERAAYADSAKRIRNLKETHDKE